MNHKLTTLALLLALPLSTQTSAWQGTYRSVSDACGKSPMVIGPGWFSYMDCIKWKASILRAATDQYLFQAAPGKCSMAEWVFSVRRASGRDVAVTAFASPGDLEKNEPRFECYYESAAKPRPAQQDLKKKANAK